MEPNKKAVILLSGGLDSITALAMAKRDDYKCYALSFEYGQKHSAELTAAKRIARQYNVIEHKIIHIDLGLIGGSALTDSTMDVPQERSQGIPITYVPARNTIFLSFALGYAEVVNADNIIIGVNAIDYSGYPDCRPEFINAFQSMADKATQKGVEGSPIMIHAPLINMTKAEIITQGISLGVDYSQTISCYAADMNGFACGKCDSCHLRKIGFESAGIKDVTQYF